MACSANPFCCCSHYTWHALSPSARVVTGAAGVAGRVVAAAPQPCRGLGWSQQQACPFSLAIMCRTLALPRSPIPAVYLFRILSFMAELFLFIYAGVTMWSVTLWRDREEFTKARAAGEVQQPRGATSHRRFP